MVEAVCENQQKQTERHSMPWILTRMRQWLLRRLGIDTSEALDGRWWEVDLLLVLLLGGLALGLLAWSEF